MTKINFNGEINTTTELTATYIEDQIKGLIAQHNGNVDVRITAEHDIARLQEKIEKIIAREFYVNDNGGIEIYDVDEVYGLVSDCWRDTLKEIHSMEM